MAFFVQYKIWTDLSILSRCTCFTDGWTDTFLIVSSRWHSMQRGKNLLRTVFLTNSNWIYMVMFTLYMTDF